MMNRWATLMSVIWALGAFHCSDHVEICDADSPCGPSEFCDYQPSTCGAGDETGTCQPRPEICDDDYDPTCGCDGVVYSNGCRASAAGVDVSDNGGCNPPDAALFPCGAGFCDATMQFCQQVVSDVGGMTEGYVCNSLPTTCGAVADCACLSEKPCGEMCTGDGSTGLMLTCPGG